MRKIFDLLNELIILRFSTLHKSSLLIMLSTIINSGFGFLFWVITAKYYSINEVGVATASISLMNLIILVSRLGLDQSLIRFFPDYEKNKIINTSIFITTIVAFTLTLCIFLLPRNQYFDMITSIEEFPFFLLLIYFILIIGNSIISLIGLGLLSLRKPKLYLFQNIIISLKIIPIVPLVFLGIVGIFLSQLLPLIVALVLSLYYLAKYEIKLKPIIDRNFLKESFHFSSGNFLSGILIMGPHFLLPIIIISFIGPKETATYYMVYSITALLFLIPNAITTSLSVEGSYGINLWNLIIDALKMNYAILMPLVIILYLTGPILLNIIGPEYSEGIGLFNLMILSSLFVSILYIFFGLKRVQKDIFSLLLVNIFTFITQIMSSVLFLKEFGIIGIGYAWIFSYLISSILIFIFHVKAAKKILFFVFCGSHQFNGDKLS